jgi:hypothetical protein
MSPIDIEYSSTHDHIGFLQNRFRMKSIHAVIVSEIRLYRLSSKSEPQPRVFCLDEKYCRNQFALCQALEYRESIGTLMMDMPEHSMRSTRQTAVL